MTNFVDEVKERKYATTEYSLDDGSQATAVECLPESTAATKERLNVTGLDDLKVAILVQTFTDVKLKKKVHEAFNKKLKPLQKDLASIIFDGKDLLYPLQTYQNAQQVREIYLLHAINQIYKYVPS